MGLARGRPRAPPVLARGQPVRGRPASWSRHRPRGCALRSCAGHGRGDVRRQRADARAHGDDPHRRRREGVADAPRVAARAARRPRRRGRCDRRCRPFGRRRARRPLRAPGRACRRDGGLHRPADVAAAAGGHRSPDGSRAAARTRTCSPRGSRAASRFAACGRVSTHSGARCVPCAGTGRRARAAVGAAVALDRVTTGRGACSDGVRRGVLRRALEPQAATRVAPIRSAHERRRGGAAQPRARLDGEPTA